MERPLVVAGDRLVVWGGFDGTNLMPDGMVAQLPLSAEP
jgi:hypothetical protein